MRTKDLVPAAMPLSSHHRRGRDSEPGGYMALLPPEPFIHPVDLLSTPPQTDGPRWWVLHTRPRAEKALARAAHERGLGFFLPLYRHEWQAHGRRFRSYLPLFPSYVFLHGDEAARLGSLQTNLVARVISANDQQQLREDLARVYRLMMSPAPLTPEGALEPGTAVTVKSGPFAGLEGKVLRRKKRLRLVVEVRLLGRGVSLEIERWMLQPAR